MAQHNTGSLHPEVQHHEHAEHHITPFDVYLKVFAALVFLTVITVWIAQFHFGVLNGFIAMGVATIKATLVAMYFMMLKYDNKLYVVILISAVAFLFLMFGFTLLDYDTREFIRSTL